MMFDLNSILGQPSKDDGLDGSAKDLMTTVAEVFETLQPQLAQYVDESQLFRRNVFFQIYHGQIFPLLSYTPLFNETHTWDCPEDIIPMEIKTCLRLDHSDASIERFSTKYWNVRGELPTDSHFDLLPAAVLIEDEAEGNQVDTQVACGREGKTRRYQKFYRHKDGLYSIQNKYGRSDNLTEIDLLLQTKVERLKQLILLSLSAHHVRNMAEAILYAKTNGIYHNNYRDEEDEEGGGVLAIR